MRVRYERVSRQVVNIGATRGSTGGGTTWFTRAPAHSDSGLPSAAMAQWSFAMPSEANPPQQIPTPPVGGAPTRVTRSPGFRCLTRRPVATTRPTLSWPRMDG